MKNFTALSLIFGLLLMLPLFSKSQDSIAPHLSSTSFVDSLIDIQHISLAKSDLFPFVQKYIRQQADSNNLFKHGYGYISLRGIKTESFSRAPLNSTSNQEDINNWMNDKIASFTIQLESHPFLVRGIEGDCWRCDDYPLFYTLVDGRLVLLYDEVVDAVFATNRTTRYTEKSKKQLAEIVVPFLKHALETDFLFLHPLDPRKEFRLSENEKKKMTEHEIFKRAAFTLSTSQQKYFLTRSGVVKPED